MSFKNTVLKVIQVTYTGVDHTIHLATWHGDLCCAMVAVNACIMYTHIPKLYTLPTCIISSSVACCPSPGQYSSFPGMSGVSE